MLHLLYILAFTILAFLAVGNLIRNLLTLSAESSRTSWSAREHGSSRRISDRLGSVSHPEMLDASGNLVREPLLVMRSMTVEDARDQLDAIYKASPGSNEDAPGEAQ